MTNAEAVALGQNVLTPNSKQQPVVLVRGKGIHVWDGDGRRYLDMIGGIAVTPLGHGHPAVTEALREQSERIWHTSNVFYNEPALRLAEKLRELSFARRVFLCNSGTEANEAALKIARRYHHLRGDTQRVEVVSFTGSFHGRTLGSLAATAQPKYHEGVGPLPPGFRYLPFGDLDALRAAVNDKTAAVICEIVQGEGGLQTAPKGFIEGLRRICDDKGALWIDDEVQSGLARSGTLWAYEAEGVRPDIMTLAKGLGNGIPVGAMLASEEVGRALTSGSHNSTFGGNPLACACALVVIDVITKEKLWEASAQGGEYLRGRLAELKRRLRKDAVQLREIRGRGLWVGAEIDGLAAPIIDRCRELGMLVNAAGDRVVRMAPALTIEHTHLDEAVDLLERALRPSTA
jgi:acetylornithine/N-succinyldiaminopimelate aminotransferase